MNKKHSSVFVMNLKVLKYVFKFCPLYVIFSFLYIIAITILNLAQVNLIAKAVKIVIDSQDIKYLYKAVMYFLIILVITHIIITVYKRYLQDKYWVIYRKKMMKFIYSKVRHIDMASYDDPEFHDRFTRGLRDSNWRGMRVFDTFIDFLRNISLSIALGVFVAINTGWILVLIIVTSAINIFFLNQINKSWFKIYRESMPFNRYLRYIKREFYKVENIPEFKTSNIGKMLINKYRENTNSIMDLNYKGLRKRIPFNIGSSLITSFIQQGLSYAYLGFKLVSGMALDVFSATTGALVKITSSITGTINVYAYLREHSLYIGDFLWILEYKPSVETKGGKEVTEEFKKLEVNNVSFSYPRADRKAIDNMSLVLNKGSKIAIVGDNGGGKTTLMKLLLKFYSPSQGNILINGVEFNDLNTRSLRKKYSIIFQDFQLYAISIAENILMKKLETKEEERIVWEALEKVGLKEKVTKLENGIRTLYSKEFDESGAVFSKGETQRIIIARVFASNADIYILDEPTAALDPLSEERINKLIIKNAGNKTIIIIAHRLSSVVDTDKIYLIQKGMTTEQGSHSELLELNGQYSKMFNAQKSMYEKNKLK